MKIRKKNRHTQRTHLKRKHICVCCVNRDIPETFENASEKCRENRTAEKATSELLSLSFRCPHECHGTIYFHRRKIPSKEAKRNSGKRVRKIHRHTHIHWMELNSSKCHMISIRLSSFPRRANDVGQRSTNGFDKTETHSKWQYDHLKMLKLKIMSMCWLTKRMAYIFFTLADCIRVKCDTEISDYGKYKLTRFTL